MRECTICVHEARATIDQEILKGTSYRKLQRRFQVSTSALGRHREKHLVQELAAAERSAGDWRY